MLQTCYAERLTGKERMGVTILGWKIILITTEIEMILPIDILGFVTLSGRAQSKK